MEVITTWLKGARNYQVGVRLYNQLGNDKTLLQLLNSETETPFKKEKLVKALQVLVTAPTELKKEEDAQVNETSLAAATVATFKRQWPESACNTADEKSLWEKAVILLKERAYLHATLFHQPDDNARRIVAFRILRKDDELTGVYNSRKYLLLHGQLPEEDKPSDEYVTDPFLMAKRIATLQRYINRTTNPERLLAFKTEYNYYARLMKKTEVPC